eukprot:comp17719_c0_seq1/m.17640 comp17719_c0_seq1/g.17640  ORF comp17719_c0_seq1/g.17640 comp17719_c0_seq1/m.17640 type:complete len:440 (-) comp17719_c0_seq1:199-1518(-)
MCTIIQRGAAVHAILAVVQEGRPAWHINRRGLFRSVTNMSAKKREILDFFEPKNKKQKTEGEDKTEWAEYQKTAFIGRVGRQETRSKIAAFDVDDTIITTKSGKKFPVDTHDWKFLFDCIPAKLQDLHKNGYRLVFFTNQNGILKGKVKATDFYKKLNNVVAKAEVPVLVLGSIDQDKFRKPVTGLWKILAERENKDTEINLSESFFVGDAAGRPEKWKPKAKKDFSDTDRQFARNIGIKFHTPEEYFLKERPAPFTSQGFDPSTLAAGTKVPDYSNLVSKKQEVILNVGFPASGKTTFSKRYLIPAGYEHINQDTLKTWQKCVAACEAALAKGKSVVIDNTNPDSGSRARYIEVARKKGVPVRCFRHTASFEHCRHNNVYRNLRTGQDQIPMLAFNMSRSKFEEPDTKEGITEIVKIDFVPDFEGDEEAEALYRLFLT